MSNPTRSLGNFFESCFPKTKKRPASTGLKSLFTFETQSVSGISDMIIPDASKAFSKIKIDISSGLL